MNNTSKRILLLGTGNSPDRAVSRLLEAQGHTVRILNNAKAALAYLEKKDNGCDLVILNGSNVPGASLGEMIARIRAIPERKHTSIILHTTHDPDALGDVAGVSMGELEKAGVAHVSKLPPYDLFANVGRPPA